jgi:hypothetical protein
MYPPKLSVQRHAAAWMEREWVIPWVLALVFDLDLAEGSIDSVDT